MQAKPQTFSGRVAALAATLIAGLLIGIAPQAGAATTSGDAAAQAPSPARGHEYPGAPKDTPRCRKLLRKIERARKAEDWERLNRLARRYNRTCRIK